MLLITSYYILLLIAYSYYIRYLGMSWNGGYPQFSSILEWEVPWNIPSRSIQRGTIHWWKPQTPQMVHLRSAWRSAAHARMDAPGGAFFCWSDQFCWETDRFVGGICGSKIFGIGNMRECTYAYIFLWTWGVVFLGRGVPRISRPIYFKGDLPKHWEVHGVQLRRKIGFRL